MCRVKSNYLLRLVKNKIIKLYLKLFYNYIIACNIYYLKLVFTNIITSLYFYLSYNLKDIKFRNRVKEDLWINIPFNVAVVPATSGTRVSVLTGFNRRKR